MRQKFKVFYRQDGFSESNLLQFGVDHIKTALHLFNQSPNYYDSAGYLSHIGVELILKSWLLYVFNNFDGDHNLERLYGKITTKYPSKELPIKHHNTLLLLDKFEELRYPSPLGSVEIGSNDSQKIENLINSIFKRLPNKSFFNTLNKISILNKGGRVLMEKKVSSQ